MSAHEIERMRDVYAEYERIGKWDTPNPGRLQMEKERSAALEQVLAARSHNFSNCTVLDVGCGGGKLLGWFHEQGVPSSGLVGVDLMPYRIERARRNFPDFTFLEANAEHLQFPDASFDLVSTFTVFSSILDQNTAANVARSIARVLKPGGAVLWYDLRYPSPGNPNVRAMTRSRIQDLFPGFELKLASITLLPPLADRLGHLARTLYPALSRVPLLRSHYVGLLVRSA